ncbi:MAG: DUF1573 domain-containing protein [Planctomycetota bacterium]|nr:DUF1573 domain-containing protein [Planctomycetota bacterium]
MPARPRRIRRLVLILLPLVVIAALGAGWWYMAVGRFPLRGDLRHDFGEVPIYGRSADVDHTFHLRNVTDRPVVIEQIHQSCGCTAVRETSRTIEPGATVDITVTLSLTRAGKKSANVALVMKDLGVQRLWVYGTGRKEMDLWTSQIALDLTPGETTPLLVFAAIQSSDEEPQTPAIRSPQGVSASFVAWERLRRRDADRKTAAEWRGKFMIELHADTLPANASLYVELGEAETLPVALALKPTPQRETGADDGEPAE